MGDLEQINHALSIRSTKGCWTCRLRKKKCDEIRPNCRRCKSVSIDCHYGAKPTWIERPELGKEELERIKLLVSAASRRTRAEQKAKVRSISTFLPPAEPPPVPVVNSHTSSCTTSEDPRSIGFPFDETKEISDLAGSSWLSAWIKDQEANLIMHYLDHVFYIQFRFYNPSVSEGGRGWFLALITRTKPLYHAALSLAAFHQQSIVLLEQGDGSREYLDELERQHNLTLTEMQLFIQAQNLQTSKHTVFDHNVQILACVVQMISFELFNGGVSNWQMHLQAGRDLVLLLHDNSHNVDRPQTHQLLFGVQSPEASALRFFTGCIIWFDTLSTISTDSHSNLAQHHRSLLLGPTPETGHNIELHTIGGARNWVMILIGEIASLSTQRSEWRRVIDYNAQGFESSVREIEFRLRSQRRKVQEELGILRQQHRGTPPHSLPDIYNKYIVLVVTNIFAAAAIIYLQTTVTSSDISPSTIHLALENSIEAMRMVPDPRFFRGLIWPLCVAGCMASTSSDQEFFRGAISEAINDARSFGNSGKAMELLERSWLLQIQRGKLVNCSTTPKNLGNCVLLV